MKNSLFLISILILAGCTAQITSATIHNITIPLEVAITPEQHTQGLMFRTNITGGMLFPYSDEKPRVFWMKNTVIPLDMIFIDAHNKIVTIHHAVPCKIDPCKVYPSNPAQYVLEVNGNFTTENNINIGDSVTFT